MKKTEMKGNSARHTTDTAFSLPAPAGSTSRFPFESILFFAIHCFMPYNLPRLGLPVQAHSRMGRAGGGKADAPESIRQCRGHGHHVFFPRLFRFRPVEEDGPDKEMFRKERHEIIGHDGGFPDVRIQAPRPHAGRKHIPQRYPFFSQFKKPLFVRKLPGNGKNLLQYGPESVPGMGIVLLRPEGCLAGHASQDQGHGVR